MAVVALLLALAIAQPSTANAALPRYGVLVPGKSLAGVRLGDSKATVRKRWGVRYTLCDGCRRETWLYLYGRANPVGAAVSFRGGRVSAVFTLGSPRGWRTREGLMLGEAYHRVRNFYGALLSTPCIGYDALLMRTRRAVTSIYLTGGEFVYGFALTLPSEPVCQ